MLSHKATPLQRHDTTSVTALRKGFSKKRPLSCALWCRNPRWEVPNTMFVLGWIWEILGSPKVLRDLHCSSALMQTRTMSMSSLGSHCVCSTIRHRCCSWLSWHLKNLTSDWKSPTINVSMTESNERFRLRVWLPKFGNPHKYLHRHDSRTDRLWGSPKFNLTIPKKEEK